VADLSSYLVTGENNPDKQVSVTFWNAFINALEDAISDAEGGDFQPSDSDLTAIAALATTTFGRSLLTLADAAALAAAHNHDDRYLTEAETATAISTAIAALVDSSPASLDTLNELAAALGDDANFATTVTNSLAAKADLTDLSWTPNFSSDGEIRFRADEAMTLTQQATSGTGSIAYEKSTAAAPGTFSSTSSPITLEAGAWLKATASSVSSIYAVHLKRTA
jgi:hypothetical protein